MTRRVLQVRCFVAHLFLNAICAGVLLPFMATELHAADDRPTVAELKVRGNGKVESDAILTLLKTRQGDLLNPKTVQEDIRTLYDLGYFSDVRFLKKNVPGGIQIIIQVAEKPAITKIEFKGMEEVTEDSLKDKLKTKLYTIVNEATVTSDLRVIEKEYAEKGYYLARAHYNIEKSGANEVTLTYVVEEGGEVRVGEVFILGNKYFTEANITNELALKPVTRSSSYSSSASPGASLFKEDYLKRDTEFISYYYRDFGFAEVKIAKPIVNLDPDREYVRVTFQVEEGIQYNVGTIDVSGDLLFTKEELFEAMKLKPGALFKYSFFTGDIEMLVDKYGDLGYAYVDVNPKTTFNREKKTVDINYEITKGEKVYFGDMTVIGNTKTRDNVVRRELTVHDSELYSGTRLTRSKKDIERLGFFEEVQVIKERDQNQSNLMHLKFKVKEKPTGQLQAAVGFTPGQGTAENNWFGQGRYDEKNQSGRAYELNLTARWNGQRNYDLTTEFFNPRVNDSQWSSGVSAFLRNTVRQVLEDVDVQERRIGASTSLGRKIVELIRGTLIYQIQKTTQTHDDFLLDKFQEEGISSSLSFKVSRNNLDNRLDPTEGTDVSAVHKVTGGPLLRGDFEYQEDTFTGAYYRPLDFTDKYRTYFKFTSIFGYIYPLVASKPVPQFERYRLGGYDDMRGFDFSSIGPKYNVLQAPGGLARQFNKGGDKKVVVQAEYFMPVIPEAGIKALVFTDYGRVFDDDEALSTRSFDRDYGFGFRWITPIAPFRFEWAYPIIDGQPGDMKFIFYIGY